MNKDIKAGADIHAGDGGYSEGTQEEYKNFAKIRNQSLLKMRLREFERASGLEIYGLGAKRVPWEAAMEKFAELIVKECCDILDPGEHQLIARFQARKWLQEHFAVEEPKGWVCPKCNADRTKMACPLGFGATVDGRCPMTVEAQ